MGGGKGGERERVCVKKESHLDHTVVNGWDIL